MIAAGLSAHRCDNWLVDRAGIGCFAYMAAAVKTSRNRSESANTQRE
jgi:hypothetical protein